MEVGHEEVDYFEVGQSLSGDARSEDISSPGNRGRDVVPVLNLIAHRVRGELAVHSHFMCHLEWTCTGDY